MSRSVLCLIPILAIAGGRSGGDQEWMQHPAEPAQRRVRAAEEAGPARAAGDLQRTAAADMELSADDGTADGSALHVDNLIVVTRLTPKVYPVQLKTIRVMFVKLSNQPDPAGKQVRLIAFADPASVGRPPDRPRMVVDQMVRIPETGRFVDFPVSGPTLDQGDLYVGYQAPSPAAGVGFAADSKGPQKYRGYHSTDNGATFKGPIAFGDGTPFNPMLRATVSLTSASGPVSEELSVDDDYPETGVVADGRMYVNRLTPPRYPAQLSSVRILFPWFATRPSPEGKKVRLVVFRDPEGAGKPPNAPVFDIDRQETIRGVDDFIDFAISGVTIERGDIYVGYQAPTPHDGVGFALDWSGPKANRSFRSLDSGRTFEGPIQFTIDGVTATANLTIRAVVRYGQAPAPEPTFTLACSRTALEMLEGGKEVSLEAGIRNPGSGDGKYMVTARVEPSTTRVKVEVAPAEIEAGDVSVITLSGLEPGNEDNPRLIVQAKAASGASATREIPIARWRTVAETTAGPDGGSIAHGGVGIAIEAGKLSEGTVLRLNAGKPRTGFEANLASEVYQLEGLPADFSGTIEWSYESSALRARPGAGRLQAAVAPTHAVVSAGGQVRMVPAPAENPKIVIDPRKLNLKDTSTVTQWLVHGYHTGTTSSGRFEIYYGQNLSVAEAVGQMLERAADALAGDPYRVEVLRGVTPPVPVYLNDLGDTVFGAADGETLQFNTRKFTKVEDVAAYGETMGHELMHFVQARYGGNAPRGAGLRSTFAWYWLDEALSTWFEPLAAGQPGYIPTTVCPKCGKGTNQSDNYRSFILRGLTAPPGDATDQEHGYGASMFLTPFFRENPGRLAGLLGARDPGSSPVDALAAQAGGVAELARSWAEFGRLYYAGEIYPGRKFPAGGDLTVEAPDGLPAFPRATDTSYQFHWKQAPELSMRPFALKFLNPNLPDWTDEVVMRVRFDPPVEDADLHVWRFSADQAEHLGSIDGKSELLLPDAKRLRDQRAVVLLGAVNRTASGSWSTRRDLKLVAEPAPAAVAVTPTYQGFKGVIGGTYEFGTKNVNVPATADYEWTIAGQTKRGRKVTHTFSSAGDHTASVRVTFGAETLRASTTITIAPDTAPTQKAEVLFDVFRRYRNAFGESNQKCNSYRVTAYAQSGAALDSGESLAANGAYTMNLPVGNGYSYKVEYTYPAPCAGSGVTTGKFDVRAGTINLVKVETPACIQ